MLNKKPSKRFLIFAILIILLFGLIFSVYVSPFAGIICITVLIAYAIGFYFYLNTQGMVKEMIATIVIIFLILGLVWSDVRSKKEAKEFDDKMTKIAESQIRPMTMEELDKILEKK